MFLKEISREQAEAIFRENASNIYRIALFLSKSPTLADDITQDTFLQAFRKFHSYNPELPIHPWLYKIALNTARNSLRKQKWLVFLKDVPDNEGQNDVEDRILANELGDELWQEIQKLSLKSRELIVLHYYSELKLNEIAEILGIPLGTCKSRLNAALRKLEKQIQQKNVLITNKGEDVYGII